MDAYFGFSHLYSTAEVSVASHATVTYSLLCWEESVWCKRLDSVISLPTSGIAKQHKRDAGGNGPVSLSAENKLFIPECSGCLSH